MQALRNESPEETLERRLRESLKVEERVYDISTYDDLQKQLGAAESKLVVLEVSADCVKVTDVICTALYTLLPCCVREG